jgi:hypothetical protein
MAQENDQIIAARVEAEEESKGDEKKPVQKSSLDTD